MLRTKIAFQTDHVRAEMRERETAEETVQFLRELSAVALQSNCRRILVVVRESRAIFKVEDFNLSRYLKAMAERAPYRVALVGDSSEAHASHGYIEVLARQRGLAVRAFREETAALEWLRRDD